MLFLKKNQNERGQEKEPAVISKTIPEERDAGGKIKKNSAAFQQEIFGKEKEKFFDISILNQKEQEGTRKQYHCVFRTHSLRIEETRTGNFHDSSERNSKRKDGAGKCDRCVFRTHSAEKWYFYEISLNLPKRMC